MCEPGNSVPEDRLPYPPPPMPRNRVVQEPPPGSAVEFSHNFFYHWVLGFPWF